MKLCHTAVVETRRCWQIVKMQSGMGFEKRRVGRGSRSGFYEVLFPLVTARARCSCREQVGWVCAKKCHAVQLGALISAGPGGKAPLPVASCSGFWGLRGPLDDTGVGKKLVGMKDGRRGCSGRLAACAHVPRRTVCACCRKKASCFPVWCDPLLRGY